MTVSLAASFSNALISSTSYLSNFLRLETLELTNEFRFGFLSFISSLIISNLFVKQFGWLEAFHAVRCSGASELDLPLLSPQEQH